MKIRMLAMAGVAALALSTPAMAADGWYLGLGGGWDNQLGINARSNGGTGAATKINSQDSAIGAVSVGYKWAEGWRLENELAFTQHDLSLNGTGAFPGRGLGMDALLVLAGPLTAFPLAMFAAGAQRVRMTTLGFMQYASPTVTLAMATFFLGEPFTLTDVLTFAFVWIGIALVSLEPRLRREQVVEVGGEGERRRHRGDPHHGAGHRRAGGDGPRAAAPVEGHLRPHERARRPADQPDHPLGRRAPSGGGPGASRPWRSAPRSRRRPLSSGRHAAARGRSRGRAGRRCRG